MDTRKLEDHYALWSLKEDMVSYRGCNTCGDDDDDDW